MKKLLGISVAALLLMAVLVPEEAEARKKRGYYGHHRSYVSFGFGYGYPGYFYSPYYGRYYGHHRYGWGPYHRYRPYVYVREGEAPPVPSGGIDINVKPEKNTQVWIDGSYVGLAKSLDGWPDYLWLPKGTYKMVLFSPGYQTVERDITVYPGVVIDFRLHLAPGESTPPQELMTPKSESASPAVLPRARDLPRTKVADAGTASVRVRDIPGEPGRLQLAVTPIDASVYLNGRFVGRGKEITEDENGLTIEPGDHVLEVVRPGHEPETLAFKAASGETVELAVRLTAEEG